MNLGQPRAALFDTYAGNGINVKSRPFPGGVEFIEMTLSALTALLADVVLVAIVGDRLMQRQR